MDPRAIVQLLESGLANHRANRLVEANALQSADSAEAVQDRLRVNYPELLRDLEPATKKLEEIFLR